MAHETSPELPDHPPQALPDPLRPSPLPAPLTSLIGRDSDVRDVAALLDDPDTRMLTITGPGGVGKTRLALALAAKVERDYADGVAYLPLAPIHDPDLVLPAIARSLGVQERGDRPILDQMIAHLRHRHLLLLLDNFEHLLATPPIWLSLVLARCPRLAVLVTSRILLGLTGEQRYVAPPLPVPASDTDLAFDEVPSVALFVRRARAVRPDFAVTEGNRASVAAICRRLDGLPLAIELAAARVSVLSPAQMLARLTGGLQLLTGGPRDAAPRQQSMFDAIAWSYDLLTADEQHLLQHLSVFVGGFTLSAAEAIDVSPRMQTVAAVSALVDSSLLRLVDDGAGPPRYLMLETIREFGLEQLAALGDEHAVRGRHADWLLRSVDRLDPTDPNGQHRWLTELNADHANLHAAMQWLYDTKRHASLQRLVLQLKTFWYLTGRWAEGLAWYERLLVSDHDYASPQHIEMLRWAGLLAHTLDAPQATTYLTEALTRARASGDGIAEAETLTALGIMNEDNGEFERAEARFLAALRHYGDPRNRWRRLVIDYHLGVLRYARGDSADAAEMLEATKAASEEIGDPHVPAWTSVFLALIATQRGDLGHATNVLRPYLDVFGATQWGSSSMILAAAAVIAQAGKRYTFSARLFGAAAQGTTPFKNPERAAFDRSQAEARRHLGDDTWQWEWEAGRRMRPPELRAEIDRLLDSDIASPASELPGRLAPSNLTRREREVLRLMADGVTNQQIADTVFISRNTVASHVAHILAKLGVESRTAAVSVAIRERLV